MYRVHDNILVSFMKMDWWVTLQLEANIIAEASTNFFC